jgi:hypothetical protein
LIFVLVARFSNLFCHATTANQGDGTGSPDADNGDHAAEECATGRRPALLDGKIKDECRRLVLVISDGPSLSLNIENKRSCLGPLLAMYKTISWGASTYLLGVNKQGAEKQGRAGSRPPRGDSKSQSTRVCIDGNSKLHCRLSILVKE